ncbi:MAG: hypothetical protein HYR84_05635 [Planctomycetes bacterium]|nr:hypothetical protein [Planctomycetota bacterium]
MPTHFFLPSCIPNKALFPVRIRGVVNGYGKPSKKTGVCPMKSRLPTLAPDAVPFWDSARRELRIGDLVIKRFRQPAVNQETILAAFQEEGWPAHIDDPLPGSGDVDREERLHDAIRRLNRQAPWMVEFRSNGLGTGIIWSFRKTTPTPKRPRSARRAPNKRPRSDQ